MKYIIIFVLSLSIMFYGCSTTSNLNITQQQQQQQEQQQIDDIIIGTASFLVAITVICIIVIHHSTKKQKAIAKAAEEKFQACVGKTKAEVYEIYGPPNSIVDDGQGQGGTILEYMNVVTYGGSDTGISSITYRSLFYLNKDNIVVSVKHDTQ